MTIETMIETTETTTTNPTTITAPEISPEGLASIEKLHRKTARNAKAHAGSDAH